MQTVRSAKGVTGGPIGVLTKGDRTVLREHGIKHTTARET